MLLILGGLLGIAFFVGTDARFMPAWATRIGWSANMVDATSDSICGTLVGLAGSAAVVCTGVWLTARRSI